MHTWTLKELTEIKNENKNKTQTLILSSFQGHFYS